jgi:hypothetical protein
VRTSDIGAVICEETWEGYRDWTEAALYWAETDTGAVCVPSLDFEGYATTGQRQHLKLTLSNSSGSTKTVSFISPFFGLGLWVPNTVLTTVGVTIGMRYKADAGCAGCTVKAYASNSFFAGSVTDTVTADDTWRAISGTWNMQDDSSGADGLQMVVTVPDGADGVLRLDDYRLTRVSNIYRTIDSTCPVVNLRADWADGFRETYGWASDVQEAEDGSEYRETLRLIPSCRLEYSVVATDPATAGRVDQWLYRYHGAVVAVPRWQDAVPLGSVTSAGHVINLGDAITSRWFAPRQRFMLWASETNFETEIIDTIPNTVTLTVDPTEGEVAGTFAAGTLVVPLVPGRLVPSVNIGRPNGSMGIYPLAFDIQMIQ